MTGSLGGRRRLPLTIAVIVALFAVILWLVFHAPDQRSLRILQGFTDPTIDDTRPLGEVFNGNPHFSGAVWSPSWSHDDHLVAVEVRLANLKDMRQDHPMWLQPIVQQCALNPAWGSIAYDQPATLLISFKVADPSSGSATVAVTSVRFTDLWIDYRASAIDGYEHTIEQAIAAADDVSQAKKYRLRHVGERALFNVGLNQPLIAGPGRDRAAPELVAALVHWR